MADDLPNPDPAPEPPAPDPTPPPPPPAPAPPAPEQPVRGIEVPGSDELGLSEGRKGMVMMPSDGDPGNLANVFGSIDAAVPIDPASAAPPPADPPPPPDSE